MKKKTKAALPLTATMSAAILFMALIGMLFLSCSSDDASSGTQRVKITFDIGYAGGVSPEPITLNKGASGGASWPPKPSRGGYKFLGWFNDADQAFDRDTVIKGNVALTAMWEVLSSAAPQPTDSAEKQALADLFTTDFPTAGDNKLSDARKIWGMNNPLVTFAFVADPSPMVYCPKLKNSGDTENHSCDECTLYVYGSNDTLAFNGNTPESSEFSKVIQGLRVVSTKDLVNWTDHGVLNLTAKNSTNPLFDSATEKVAPYATETWAPSAEWKMVNGKPKFFLYWANSGNNTSVVVSDVSPIGPFYNPGLTKSMVNKDMAGFATVSWLFDPGTMIDSDGKTYMVLGGDGNNANPGNVRRVQMKDDMTSIVGNGPELNLPWHFEATDIWKWKNIYYINYTTNWGGGKPSGWQNIDIAYVMNYDGPLEVFPTTPNTSTTPKPDMANRLLPYDDYGEATGQTNHASLFDFKGKPYLIYHTSSACRAFGATRLRTAHLVDIVVNSDGTLKQAAMGVTGVAQIADFNPYNVTEAETMAIQGGVYTKGKGNADVGNGISVASIDTGDWLGLYGVNFDKKSSGATTFNAIVKVPVTAADKEYTGAIEIWLDPIQQGINNLTDKSRLSTSANAQSRITKGENTKVVGHVQVKVKEKTDEGKWVQVSAELDEAVKGKHDLAFVFYSSTGAALERFTGALTPAKDGRTRDVGFEIDQWWFE